MIGTTGRCALGALVAIAAAGSFAGAQETQHGQGVETSSVVPPLAVRTQVVMEDSATAPGGPRLAAASVALRTQPADHDTRELAAASSSGLTHGQVYMIVGGAAFIVGAIVGHTAGTIVMLGGAGVGIYGLYLYLDHNG
jgi:hypothetical protein